MKSVSFDRAAHIYDETRGFPPGIGEQVAQAAIDWIGPQARVLEVGVGTGRIAKPLLAHGVNITGADLSPKMMRRLLETLPPGTRPPPLILADAAQLPFATASFDAVLSVHVFHLIAHWREALAEVRRMLKPSGILLSGYDWRPPDSPGDRLGKKWKEIIRSRGIENQPGTRDFEDVKATLFAMGATMEECLVGEWTTTRTLARHLETIEHRTWSATWDVPDDFFPQALAELQAWATRTFGALETEFTVPHRFVWQKFRF
jgi:SAM-dependent methyltransferase